MSSDVATRHPADDTLVGSFAHLGRRLRWLVVTERGVYILLGIAMLTSAGLILWLNRGTTFFVDELFVFGESSDLSPRELVEPVNGHLVATPRFYSAALLNIFGASYLPFRILHVATLLLAAGLFFVVAKRRVGALPALAPTVVLLFLGSAWQHVVSPIGTGVLVTIAAGLAAVAALEREDRRGDLAACGFLCLSIATFTIGLAFLVGIAISVLIRSDRASRAWIFLVPLALYAAWWVLIVPDAQQPAGDQTRVANLLLIPVWTLDSLAVVAGALTGLEYDFARSGRPNPEVGFGRVVAVLALVALAWRISRGALPRSLWASLGIAVSYWALGALGAGLFAREPSLAKYVFPGMVVALLVVTDAARGIRLSARAKAVLFGVAAVSVATNVALLRDGGAFLRNAYTEPVRAQLAMVELARDHVQPTFNPFAEVPEAAPDAITVRADSYLASVDRFGSPAFSIPELEQRGEQVRHDADLALAHALELGLRPGGRVSPPPGCETVRPRSPRDPIRFELAPGANTLTANAASPVSIELMRFADEMTVPVGDLEPRRAATLSIPEDRASQPWIASISGARSVTVCHRAAESVG